MARIIGEAAIRLRVDGRGLGRQIRTEVKDAVKEASGGPSPFESLERDSETSARRIGRSFASMFSVLGKLGGGFASVVAQGLKLSLIAVAAGGALAAIVQLGVAVGTLGAALAQASGVAGLLPAALAGLIAVQTTVKLGTVGMGDAFKAVAEGDATALAESLEKLAPSAREFVLAVRDVKPAFDSMRLSVQQRMFEGLAEVIQPLADRYLPIARDLFGGLADSIAAAGREAAGFALSERALANTNVLTGNLKTAFDNLVVAVRPALSGLLDLTTVGSSFLPRMTEYVAQLAQRFGDFMQNAAKSGELEAFFERAIAALQALGRIAGNVFGAIGNIMDAAQASSGGMLVTIEKMTAAFEGFTGSARGMATFEKFFDAMGRIVDALGPVFLELVAVIGQQVIPIIADLVEIIAPVLTPVLRAIGMLLEAMRPVLGALAKAFATVLEAMVPFFEALGEAIDAALPVLLPMIDDIAEAMGNLFEAMVPLAPVFVELLVAILPILPPLIQLIADIMPQIIELIRILIPVIDAWVQMMVTIIPVISSIIQFLLAVFIPIIQLLAWIFEGVYTAINASIQAIGAAFSWLGTNIRETWDTITGIFSTAAKAVVNFVTEAFNTVKNIVGGAMNFVLNGVGDAVGGVINFFVQLPGNILGALGNVAEWLVGVGRDIIRGLLNGLKAAAGAIRDFFTGLIEDAIGSVKSMLGIGSPSKVFAGIGRDIGRGLIVGLGAISPAVADAAQAMVDTATTPLSSPLSAKVDFAGPTGTGTAALVGGGARIINQTNVMQPGTDARQFSELVMRRGMDDVLGSASTLQVNRNAVQSGVDDQQLVGVR